MSVGGGLLAFCALAAASAYFFCYSSLYAISASVGGGGSILIVYYGFLSVIICSTKSFVPFSKCKKNSESPTALYLTRPYSVWGKSKAFFCRSPNRKLSFRTIDLANCWPPTAKWSTRMIELSSGYIITDFSFMFWMRASSMFIRDPVTASSSRTYLI